VVYGKVAADDRSKVVGAVLSSLQWRLNGVHTRRRFRIPRIVGYWPDLRLILLESIPGKPQVSELLEAHVMGMTETEPSVLMLEEALHDCALVAAALHKVNIKLDNQRTFKEELDSLHAYMPPVEQFSLALSMQLQHALRRLQAYAEKTPALPLCFSHGDYTYTQLIFDDTYCGLVDFDTVCRAEPALDLGQFLAYLRLAARKAQRRASEQGEDAVELNVDDLCQQFLHTYIRAAGYTGAHAEQLRARVAAYEIISLMRIALLSWQKLKSSRLELAAELLEGRVAGLQ
jgi:aminoglycoside phosphotransferase (APT) family kinase protein